MTETYFPTASIRLHGARLGQGPLVVYMHGITANWSVWEPILGLLSHATTGVAVSQRGHGQSDHPRDGYGADGYTADVIALVESLGLGPAILVGHSLGARNAVVAAARRPDLVSAVLAVDFVPQVERAALDALADRVNKGSRTFESCDAVRAYLSGRYPKLPGDAIERRAVNGFRDTPDGLAPWADADAMRATAQGLYEDYEADYRANAVPTIAVRGQESLLTSSEAFEQAKALRPDIEHVVIGDTDHYVPEENPHAIARLVVKLLSVVTTSQRT